MSDWGVTWIIEIDSFCHVAFVGMPYCFKFTLQNVAEIGQLVDDL